MNEENLISDGALVRFEPIPFQNKLRRKKMKKILMIVFAAMLSMSAWARTEYMVELEFSQTSFTLSLTQHIKDAMNAFTVSFPTTKEFYDSVSVGDVLGEKFKGASFLVGGNIGSRKVVVKRKYKLERGQ